MTIYEDFASDLAVTMWADLLLTGRTATVRHGFRDLIEEQAADFLAPDVPKTGGIAETKKIGDMAGAYYQRSSRTISGVPSLRWQRPMSARQSRTSSS